MSFPARVLACLLAGALGVTGALGVPGPAQADPAPAPASAAAPKAARGDLTLQMRDLFVARPQMGFVDGLRADLTLARPTDGIRDPGGDGYRRDARRVCSRRLCVHHVTRGTDRATPRWARRTLRVLNRVWRFEVGRLNFRRPPRDGQRGGDGRFDVYLSDLGSRGVYGYCAPERRVRGERRAASGYCVLDNDFAHRQYGVAPGRSLRVTAAHEFFHAIQFGYDFRADPWLLESTATWMEEQFADRVDDNRRYLRFGAVRRPWLPLDTYDTGSYAHYGNWAFWEFLSQRHGRRVVRAVWRLADARDGARNLRSVAALARVLDRREGLRLALTAFAVANLTPARSYAEGRHWPRARVHRTVTLHRAKRRSRDRVRVDHLAAGNLAYRPRANTRGTLRVRVTGPRRRAAARVVVERRNGPPRVIRVRLGDRGRGAVTVPFAGSRVQRVVVTVVNASMRDDRAFRVQVRAQGR